jgi:predicted transposase YbfD/YdcC
MVFVADALHAQTIHTQDLTRRGAVLLVRVKANQRGVFDRLWSLPWPKIPVGDRTRRITGETKRETAYLIVTLPHDQAAPIDLNLWARLEWHIENRSHWVRDLTLREDEQRARTGNGAAVFAALRNAAIGYHRTDDAPDIARATHRADRSSSDLIRAVTSTGAAMQ